MAIVWRIREVNVDQRGFCRVKVVFIQDSTSREAADMVFSPSTTRASAIETIEQRALALASAPIFSVGDTGTVGR